MQSCMNSSFSETRTGMCSKQMHHRSFGQYWSGCINNKMETFEKSELEYKQLRPSDLKIT